MITRRNSAASSVERHSGRSARNVPGSLSPQQCDGWRFAPEGAAVHVDERVAVIADVHLGYEWARGACGDCVPAHSLAETLTKLARLLARTATDRLVVAGDLVESPGPCARTAHDVRCLEQWLSARGVTLVAVAGNHDPSVQSHAETLEVAGWTVAHGHRPIAASRTISGHHHPVLRAGGHSAPCFLWSASAIVLPAFTSNAAGLDVMSRALPRAWREHNFRCLVCASDDWLDFGPLSQLNQDVGWRRAARRRGPPRQP